MLINALNSGARAFMADLEDALSPTWANVLGAQATLLDAVNREVGARLDVTLAARIGVNTGDLLAPTAGALDLGTLAGDVLNVAARLQEVAEPNQIVVSERTARSATSFRFDDLGVVDVRGRARPLHVFLLAGTGERRSMTVKGPFLGREDAIGSLRTTFNKVVAEGRPAHVVVMGDPGVGKSRLVREFVDWASALDPSLTTLTGRCLPYGQDVVYRPLAEILTDLTGITATTDAVSARGLVEHDQLRVEHEASQVLLHKNNFTLIIGAMNLPTVS